MSSISSSLKSNGFTIVELLIVIVVIGILAAITIVSYNGIQQRANNTARIAAAQQAIKLIKAYRATNGTIPVTNSPCLTNVCTDFAGTPVSTDNSTLRNQLSTIGNAPAESKAAGKYYGIWYNTRAAGATFDDSGASDRIVLIMYWLDGLQQNCGVADVATQGAGEAWRRSTNSYSYSYTNENVTACWVSV